MVNSTTARTTHSSNIDDKTLHEVEVWPYAEAVRAGTACVMTSYPYVNNSQASQNAHLMNEILKTHLGFQGYTQSDWFALKSGVHAMLAGLDQDMPGIAVSQANSNDTWSYYGANYTAAVRNGTVPEWRLTDAATRILTPYYWLGQDRNYPSINLEDDPRKTITNAQRQRRRAVAREVAFAGTVLLKNTAGKKRPASDQAHHHRAFWPGGRTKPPRTKPVRIRSRRRPRGLQLAFRLRIDTSDHRPCSRHSGRGWRLRHYVL